MKIVVFFRPRVQLSHDRLPPVFPNCHHPRLPDSPGADHPHGDLRDAVPGPRQHLRYLSQPSTGVLCSRGCGSAEEPPSARDEGLSCEDCQEQGDGERAGRLCGKKP